MLGKENMELDNFTEIAELKDFEILEFQDVPFDFSVSEPGDYEIALVACSRGSACSTIRIASIAVDALGLLSAPAEVSELSVTPNAEDALAAEIKFTLPSLTLDNQTLTNITSAEILVDDVLAATLTNLTPGQQISHNVTDIPSVGKHKFTVRIANANGFGKSVSTYAFIGCYTAPWSESFDNAESIEFWTDEYNFTPNGFGPPMSYNTYASAIEMAYYATEADYNMWMFSPDFKLDEESVYTYSFDYNDMYYGEEPMYLTMGKSASSETQSKLMELPSDSRYKFVPHYFRKL